MILLISVVPAGAVMCWSNMECSFLFAKTIAKEGNETEFLKYFNRPVNLIH